MTTKLRHQEDQIRALQVKICNIKVKTAAQTAGHVLEGGGYCNKGGKLIAPTQNGCAKCPTYMTKKSTTTTTAAGCTDTIPGRPIRLQHACRRDTDQRSKQHVAT